MTAATPLLSLQGVSAGYRRHVVLDSIDLSLARGQITCVLGPNGSGKTTLFRTLLGLLPPLAGRIEVLGMPPARWSRAEFARHVGYVPQAHDAPFAFTAEDIVLMGRAARVGLFATPSRQDREVARQCLATLGVSDLAPRVYTQLSGGERQLVLFSRALAQEPELLVLDEPTASLDFGNQLRVLEHIALLRDLGLGVLMSTHQPEHALRIADRVVLLAEGRIIADGPPATAISAAHLARLYGVPEAAIRAGWSSLPASAW